MKTSNYSNVLMQLLHYFTRLELMYAAAYYKTSQNSEYCEELQH